MSDVVELLASIGRDPNLRLATREVLERSISDIALDPQLRAALLNGDQHALEALLGANTNVCCMVHTPEDDEEESDEEDEASEENDNEQSASNHRVATL